MIACWSGAMIKMIFGLRSPRADLLGKSGLTSSDVPTSSLESASYATIFHQCVQ